GQMADRVLIGLRESGGKTSARLTKLPALEHDKPGTGANERGQTETAGSQPSYGPDSMNSATPRELARPDSVPICRLFTRVVSPFLFHQPDLHNFSTLFSPPRT